jgi:hypothetical protein
MKRERKIKKIQFPTWQKIEIQRFLISRRAFLPPSFCGRQGCMLDIKRCSLRYFFWSIMPQFLIFNKIECWAGRDEKFSNQSPNRTCYTTGMRSRDEHNENINHGIKSGKEEKFYTRIQFFNSFVRFASSA